MDAVFPDTDAEMHARHAAGLARLTELGMALAEDLQARALAAETTEEATQAAAGFHRLSRSVRQSMALEARLRRDARRVAREADRETALQAEEAASAPVARRRAEAKAALERLVWTEAETAEAAKFWDEGARRLIAEAELAPGFTRRPAAEVVAALARDLRAMTPPASPDTPVNEIVTFQWEFVDPPDYKWTPPDTG